MKLHRQDSRFQTHFRPNDSEYSLDPVLVFSYKRTFAFLLPSYGIVLRKVCFGRRGFLLLEVIRVGIQPLVLFLDADFRQSRAVYFPDVMTTAINILWVTEFNKSNLPSRERLHVSLLSTFPKWSYTCAGKMSAYKSLSVHSLELSPEGSCRGTNIMLNILLLRKS